MSIRTVILATGLAITAAGVLLVNDSSTACAQQKQCGCEDSGSCKPSPSPSGTPTPKKTPLPPIVRRQPKNVFPPSQVPPVNNPDLPGLDVQSGMAIDTEDNFEKGRKNDYDHCSPCDVMDSRKPRQVSKEGFYQERRRYIYDTYQVGKASVGKSDGLTAQQFQRLVGVLKNKLEETNEQEREAYQKELLEEDQARVEDLDNVEKQNESRTAQVEEMIKKGDLDNFDEVNAAIEQVLRENLGADREGQLSGKADNSSPGVARAVRLIDELKKKIGSDCGKKKVSVTTVLGLERISQLMGGEDSQGLLSKCGSFTAVAKMSLPGFEFEAKKCVAFGLTGRARFNGDWKINVTGVMPLRGVANVDASGTGKWNANVILGEGSDRIDLKSNGPADVVSEGGKCLLWLKPSDSTADAQSEQFRQIVKMIPFTGKFPIQVLNQSCE